MKRYLMTGLGVAFVGALVATVTQHNTADAHCQVPCGIYDDGARIQRMLEDYTTIKKAMGQISQLAGKHDALSVNQAARWVNTKEAHASNVITTVSEYFLTQKVKEVAPGADGYKAYLEKLAAHHKVLRAAMKTKQTLDPANADGLASAIGAMAQHYATKEGS